MLHAVDQNKLTRLAENGERVRAIFPTCEDSLTSSIIGQLLYLPDSMFWEILRKSSYDSDLPKECGKIETYEFWPHWDAMNTTNARFVEPDVFIRFKNFDLIIEAKRWDENQQDSAQWENQLSGYLNEYQEGNDKDAQKRAYYLALGGLTNEKSEEFKGIKIFKSRWRRILEEIQSVVKSPSDSQISASAPIDRILKDLLTVFVIHGFTNARWLEDWSIDNPKLSENCYVQFNQWSLNWKCD